jgi:hypothetical protein
VSGSEAAANDLTTACRFDDVEGIVLDPRKLLDPRDSIETRRLS